MGKPRSPEVVAFAVRLISMGTASSHEINRVLVDLNLGLLDTGPLPYDLVEYVVEDDAKILIERINNLGAVASVRPITSDGAERIPSNPKVPPVNDSVPGNVATQILMLQGITRDPALQCRAQLDEATVAKYAEVVDKLPPVRIIRDGGTDYLVDGWHRFQAHFIAKRDTIHAVVEPGTRRDAILAAVQANSSHGLPRSHDDTRRAVKVLLMDEEWCKLSDRKLAAMAEVSHTHVANQRKQYGVKPGIPLTPEDANRIDGKLPPEWEAIAVETYYHEAFDKIRAARDPEALSKLIPENWNKTLQQAFALRASEIAAKPWPWAGEDMSEEEVEARFDVLESIDDLLAAAGSVALTAEQRSRAYKLVDLARDVETKFWPGMAATFEAEFAGRPALLARLAERVEARKAEEEAAPKSDWQLAQNIVRETNLLRQSMMVSECSVGVFRNIAPRDLQAVVRDGAYLDRMKIGGDFADPKPVDLESCPVPGCGGHLKPAAESYNQVCIRCGQTGPGWTKLQKDALMKVAELLKHPGYGFIVNGVVIDHAAIERIRVLQAAALAKPANTVKLGGDLGTAVRAFASQPRPEILCIDPKKPEPEASEEAESEYSDEQLAEELGLRGYIDGLSKPPAWVPEDLREYWLTGRSRGDAGEDPKEEMDVAIEEIEAQWQAEHEEEQDNGE